MPKNVVTNSGTGKVAFGWQLQRPDYIDTV